MTNASNILEQAHKLYIERHYSEVISLLADVAFQAPDAAEKGILIAQSYNQLKTYPLALQYLNKVLELKQDHPEALILKGDIFSNMGQYFMALDIYNKIDSFEIKDKVPLYNNRGGLLIKMSKYQEAIDNFNKAIELYPDAYYSFQGKALALYKLNHYQEALSEVNKSIQLNDQSAKGYELRSQIFAALNKIDEALQDANTSVVLSPENPDNYIRRAILLIEKNDVATAQKDLLKAKEMGHALASPLLKKYY